MYNKEYGQMALDALHSGMTLREFCRRAQRENPQFPDASTIRLWGSGCTTDARAALADDYPARYAIAYQALHNHWADEIVTIADDGQNDYMDRLRADGRVVRSVDHECVHRSKLRVDTRRWLLSKLRPDLYADRMVHQQLGRDGQPVDPPNTSQIDLETAIKGWKPKGQD